ncbi:HEAT repeat domain-containing protein [Brunnivagina elsteri]|uniref:Phycocyanobilin lyase n=1 Tax=Brunnivagina elsteri CCALA 953 TaxID=987040 RepID=A0A2A2TB17_9CYAN|nr:HEAT repeat domain-containing protein [Calothrix elsteri]PAX49854.1 phycocyanobilin lyase [Calothrix elsteri CCALA 953]
MNLSSPENFESLPPTDVSVGGESLTVDKAIANLAGADLGLRFYAAWWLGRFRVNEPQAVTALIEALTDEDDRTPEGGYPLRRNAARALGKLDDTSAVPGLIASLESTDYYLREAAAESLGTLGDVRAIPPLNILLLTELNGELIPQEGERKQPYDAILEALGNLGAKESVPYIQPFLQHSIELVQYSAARAMYQLTQEAIYGERLVKALAGDNLQLRRAALGDLGAIGYLPAADAIAQTLAENSLKIISLRGLLKHEVGQMTPPTPALSDNAIKVMKLMDSLL